jgi:hypothetical protein
MTPCTFTDVRRTPRPASQPGQSSRRQDVAPAPPLQAGCGRIAIHHRGAGGRKTRPGSPDGSGGTGRDRASIRTAGRSGLGPAHGGRRPRDGAEDRDGKAGAWRRSPSDSDRSAGPSGPPRPDRRSDLRDHRPQGGSPSAGDGTVPGGPCPTRPGPSGRRGATPDELRRGRGMGTERRAGTRKWLRPVARRRAVPPAGSVPVPVAARPKTAGGPLAGAEALAPTGRDDRRAPVDGPLLSPMEAIN